MPELATIDRCTGCGSCYSVCTRHAIKMKPDSEGFLQPVVDSFRCVECGLCTRSCPALLKLAKIELPRAYAAYTRDEESRRKSSSGGMFFELARRTISAGGCVFGCILDDEFKAVHVMAETLVAVEPMRGSKYVQSDLGDIFQEVKKQLATGRQVLFSGTPCQCAGLLAFLKTKPDNLFVVSFLCHGVPSPAVYEKCKNEIARKYKGDIVSVSLRQKRTNWRGSFVIGVGVKTPERTFEVLQQYSRNGYGRAFLANLCLRRSCYNCDLQPPVSGIDIILGDFWRVRDFVPEMDDDRGISYIVIGSGEGKAAFESCGSDLNFRELSFDQTIKANGAWFGEIQCPPGREEFMGNFARVPLIRLANRIIDGPWYCRYPLYFSYGVRTFIGTWLRKVGLRK